MSKITGKNIKDSKLDITGGDYLKNAPEKLPARRRNNKPNTIDLSDLENITGTIVGGDRIEFREKDFKTALSTLEQVISTSSLGKEQFKEFKELIEKIRQTKPGVDMLTIQTVWNKIVQIVNIAGLASGVAEKLLSTAWRAVSGYLGIG